MPSTYNLPRATGLWTQQDIALYNQLPFYLASLEAKYYPMWDIWAKHVGKIPWQTNMGEVLKGVRAEPTPIGRQQFFPNDITTSPKKDVYEQREVTETARIKRHLGESNQFNFNPSFSNFRRNQIPDAMKDIASKNSNNQDQFIRSVVFHRSPQVFISGKANVVSGQFANDELVSAPVGDGNDAGTSGKSAAWLQAAIAQIGNNLGNLGFKVINKAATILSEDIQAPYYEASSSMPMPNETLKGNYCLLTSNEAIAYLQFDAFVLANRPLMTNLINDEYKGKVGSHVVLKAERFPLRMKADGTFPAPQTTQMQVDAYNYGETVPNPEYINAPYEWAFLLGAEPYRSIQVGPPPKEFTGKMAEEDFNKLFWNGEVKLTNNILVRYPDANGVLQVDTNKYGEFVQLISSLVFGIIPVNRRYVMPILFRRVRVATN